MLLSLLLAFALPVTSQRDFDRLDERIDSVLATGERNIEVCFEPGTYFFGEEHLKFTEIEAEGVSLRLIGNGATLVGSRDSEEVPAFGNGFVDRRKGNTSTRWPPSEKPVSGRYTSLSARASMPFAPGMRPMSPRPMPPG